MPKELIVRPSASGALIQRTLNDGAARRLPVLVYPGTYRVHEPIDVPDGAALLSNGYATLVGTKPGMTMVRWAGGGRLNGFHFRAEAENVTAVGGNFVRATIADCQFWTTLSRCVDGGGLLSRIERCGFGLLGDLADLHQHVRIRGDGATNMWSVRDCDFYNAAGEAAVEFSDGYMVEIAGCNVERNRTRVAVKLAGMFTANIHDNWFENNAGEAQVELVNSRDNQVGNYVVTSRANWWHLNGAGNRWAYRMAGASCVDFDHEAGTGWDGKAIASDMTNVRVGRHMRLVGYAGRDE